jgi:hypothetical protein
MGRASTQIVIFLICLNAAAGLLAASGVAADLGIQPNVGSDDRIAATEEAAGSVNPSEGGSGTLFSAFTGGAEVIASAVTLVFYGPVMLSKIGIPLWMSTFLFAPAIFVTGLDVLFALTGRDL